MDLSSNSLAAQAEANHLFKSIAACAFAQSQLHARLITVGRW